MMASSDSTPAVAGGLARHIPVLGRPAVEFLALQAGGVYIDATFGAGGYSRAILDTANCRVIGLDRDQSAIARGADLVQAAGGRLVLVEYRGEDDAVAIKPEHKMTLRQLRQELTRLGFHFVDSLEFLPDQRVVIFDAGAPGDDREAGGDEGLARHAGGRVLGDDGVQNSVGDLVRDLVGMTFRHRLGGEHVALGWHVPVRLRFRRSS